MLVSLTELGEIIVVADGPGGLRGFITDGIDLKIYQALNTRNGKEMIGDF